MSSARIQQLHVTTLPITGLRQGPVDRRWLGVTRVRRAINQTLSFPRSRAMTARTIHTRRGRFFAPQPATSSRKPLVKAAKVTRGLDALKQILFTRVLSPGYTAAWAIFMIEAQAEQQTRVGCDRGDVLLRNVE
jgi:hypothetical protein